MKAIGIIAEYNPFTYGHLYHLNTIKEKYPEYAIIVVMNGGFTQRGDISIIDKWKRTEIALKMGVDLVIELPYPFATQSADFFAYGAITILENLKVEKLIFGSESDNIEDLEIIAKTQIENDDFEKLVKIYSKFGNNYPTAISKAVYDLTGKNINTPNDLLGISYLKTIIQNNYQIKAETIKRINNYHDKNLQSFSSASSIREAINRKEKVQEYVPPEVYPYLKNTHHWNDYFDILKYKIITEKDLSIYETVNEGMEHTLKKEITSVNTIEELIEKVKSKRFTYNKIMRMLNHILCNFTKKEKEEWKDISYIRILGLNEKGKYYLNQIKKDVTLPIISKISKEKDSMLEFEIETTKIYDIPKKENLDKKEFERIIIGDQNDKE